LTPSDVDATLVASVSSTLDRFANGIGVKFEVTGSRVRELRLARELSQGDVAVAMGVSRQTINSIETGKYVPSLPLAIGLARFFGLSVEEIFHVDKS
jgi:putative transcriptional regulator